MRSSILCIGFALAIIGCGGSPLSNIKAPDQMTLFSIDGKVEDRKEHIATEEKFLGYPVLGKVEIIDPEQRKQIMFDLNDAIAKAPSGPMTKCFWPRHAIRVVENGKTSEFIICFECKQFQEYVGQERVRYKAISNTTQDKFSKPLLDAGVPVAP